KHLLDIGVDLDSVQIHNITSIGHGVPIKEYFQSEIDVLKGLALNLEVQKPDVIFWCIYDYTFAAGLMWAFNETGVAKRYFPKALFAHTITKDVPETDREYAAYVTYIQNTPASFMSPNTEI